MWATATALSALKYRTAWVAGWWYKLVIQNKEARPHTRVGGRVWASLGGPALTDADTSTPETAGKRGRLRAQESMRGGVRGYGMPLAVGHP